MKDEEVQYIGCEDPVIYNVGDTLTYKLGKGEPLPSVFYNMYYDIFSLYLAHPEYTHVYEVSYKLRNFKRVTRYTVKIINEVSPEKMETLINEQCKTVNKKVLATSPITPLKTLEDLSNSKDSNVRAALAYNKSLSPELISKLADDSDKGVCLNIIKRPDCDITTLVHVLNNHEILVPAYLSMCSNVTTESLDTMYSEYEKLENRNINFLIKLASQEKASQEIIMKVLTDPSISIENKQEIIGNKNTSISVIEDMLNKIISIDNETLMVIANRDDATDKILDTLIEKFIDSNSIECIIGTISNANVSTRTLRKLTSIPNESLIKAILNHPNTTTCIVNAMLSEIKNYNLKNIILQNTPERLREYY